MAGTVLLFSYGTLQDKAVQQATFGRELTGRQDELRGYRRGLVPVTDPEVLASGVSHYANAEPGSNPEDVLAGMVFEITPEELAAADRYEEDARYGRVLVTLESGVQAWIYVRL